MNDNDWHDWLFQWQLLTQQHGCDPTKCHDCFFALVHKVRGEALLSLTRKGWFQETIPRGPDHFKILDAITKLGNEFYDTGHSIHEQAMEQKRQREAHAHDTVIHNFNNPA
jgi:hypothetical protein